MTVRFRRALPSFLLSNLFTLVSPPILPTEATLPEAAAPADETAKYLVADEASIRLVADLVNRHPDRFPFGTDEVVAADQAKYLKVCHLHAPRFAALTPEASEKVRKGNYERLFDEARRKVRAWEKVNVN